MAEGDPPQTEALEEEASGAHSVEPDNGEPKPDPLLKKLYNSDRPPVELCPGVGLAPVICTCWPRADAEGMLKESWLPGASGGGGAEEGGGEEAGEGGAEKPPVASFDPTSLHYTEMPKRLSRSQSMVKWNDLKIQVKRLEDEVPNIKEPEEKEEKQAELDALLEAFATAEAELGELKATFEPDPLALVPWMSTLFDLADAGMTSFDAAGEFFPHCDLKSALGAGPNAKMFDGVERLLGTFVKRYAVERGPGRVQVFTKLVPNFFRAGYAPEEVVPVAVQGMLSRIGLPAIDMVQLVWWDLKAGDVLPTLRALAALTRDKTEPDENGKPVVTEAAKVKALGLVDFPARAIKDAVQNGIPVTVATVEMSVCQGAWEVLDVCKEYNIKVIARDCLLGGLMDEKYVGAAEPCSIAGDEDVDSEGHAMDIVKSVGGWKRLQHALSVVKKIAGLRGVSMQAVALRYVMDHGAFPSATMRWPPHPWAQFGHLAPCGPGKPGVDAPLLHRDSFLAQSDMEELAALSVGS